MEAESLSGYDSRLLDVLLPCIACSWEAHMRSGCDASVVLMTSGKSVWAISFMGPELPAQMMLGLFIGIHNTMAPTCVRFPSCLTVRKEKKKG